MPQNRLRNQPPAKENIVWARVGERAPLGDMKACMIRQKYDMVSKTAYIHDREEDIGSRNPTHCML